MLYLMLKSRVNKSYYYDEDLTIHRNVVPHLDVLTAGEVVEYPSDIVDSSKLPAIFEYVRDEYDVVMRIMIMLRT